MEGTACTKTQRWQNKNSTHEMVKGLWVMGRNLPQDVGMLEKWCFSLFSLSQLKFVSKLPTHRTNQQESQSQPLLKA